MINRYERLNQELKMVETKRKVAAYCRVSTDNEDQANSFESQQRYFRQYIERNPDWELYEIFADEGISGTNTKKRKEFNRMIACAKNGDFDLIITKEISRFARNTLDSIYYTRELKKHGVGVIFMNDNINTLDGDAELRLAIMSSIAQEESRKTSERVKWGQKRQMEQGVVFGRSMLGYDVEGGKMTINEEGAKVVRLIFHKFVNEGKGTHVIARELREEGISPMRVKEWSNTVILRVIRNEKYCGDLVQKKTYTPDFLSHEKKYNRGQEEFVIIKDHHEPIISRELFDEANRILDAKSLSQEGKAKHSNRYPFSGKIKCGCCGSSYVARYKTRKDGSRYKAWRCNEAAKHGSPHIDKAGNQVGCTGLSIRNEDATHIMYLVTKSLKYNRDKIINNLTAVIQSIIAMDTTGTDVLKLQEQIKKIEGKRANLIDLYMSNLINKDEFTATRASCDAEIEELQSIIESVDKQREMIEQQQQLLKEIEDAIKEIVGGVEYEDEFYKHILDKMVVQDKDNIDVYLNLLPMKWSYTVAKASKKAVASEWNISEASVPFSFFAPSFHAIFRRGHAHRFSERGRKLAGAVIAHAAADVRNIPIPLADQHLRRAVHPAGVYPCADRRAAYRLKALLHAGQRKIELPGKRLLRNILRKMFHQKRLNGPHFFHLRAIKIRPRLFISRNFHGLQIQQHFQNLRAEIRQTDSLRHLIHLRENALHHFRVMEHARIVSQRKLFHNQVGLDLKILQFVPEGLPRQGQIQPHRQAVIMPCRKHKASRVPQPAIQLHIPGAHIRHGVFIRRIFHPPLTAMIDRQ